MTKLLAILFLCSAVINIYLLNVTEETQNDLGQEIIQSTDKVKVAQSAIKKIVMTNPTRQKNLNQIKNEVLEIESKASTESENTDAKTIDQKESPKQVWIREVKLYMVSKLGLNIDQVNEYLSLGEKREQELESFIQSKVENNETFFYTVEDIVSENKINEKYLSKLIETLGDEAYKKYRIFRDEFNQEMIKKGDSSFLVEL